MDIELAATPESIATAAASPAEMDRLGDEIAELSAHLEAVTARLLELIREFDARGGWNQGFRSCAHWLAWRVGMNRGAAREHVRVARALGSLPRLADALARGELSYSKVRALTRVATPEIEERLLAVGRAGTACHVERIVRGWRRVDRIAEAREAAHRHKARGLHVYEDEDGMVVIRGRLTPEAGAVLRQALDAARETLYRRARCRDAGASANDVPEATPSMAQEQADALALLAETALHRGIDPGAPGDRYQVVVHVDAQVLADPEAPGQSVLEGGTHVPAETSRRLACDASRVVMRHDPDGRVVEVGARTRTIPPAIRRALHNRDRGCRFPGCGLPFGQGHHIRHWAQGGPTTLSNLAISVGAITARCTRRDTRWNDSPTASYSSGDRTDDLCPTSRLRPSSLTIPSGRCGCGTRRRGYICTLGRPARAGWGSLSTWAGRSGPCTLVPFSPWQQPNRTFTRSSELGLWPWSRHVSSSHARGRIALAAGKGAESEVLWIETQSMIDRATTAWR